MLTKTDFYKVGHKFQYPKGTTMVFSNMTARKSRMEGTEKVVFFGLTYYINKYLIEGWNREFFSEPLDEVVNLYKRKVDACLQCDLDVSHIVSLHKLGYLPLEIHAIDEGTEVPIGVPMLVMWNTHPDHFWLTNYIETSMSATLWGMCTSATIALKYRRIIKGWMEKAGGDLDFVNWQGHDFSFRGMFGIEAAAMSGAGHLLAFDGTDTIPAIELLEEHYNDGEPIVAGSVAATEHSVMCMGGKEDEIETYRRLITEVYPKGIVSIVSDTWDFWKLVTEGLPKLKDLIMSRDGKVVIRPDSGDPVKIICGDPEAKVGTPEYLGAFELLWTIFGGTVNKKGFKVLDPHIGLIYGDSITPERCEAIMSRLVGMGFVPSMVFGIGSYTYQYNTRDTFGFAIKSTYGEVDGVGRDIFKDPKTDDGTKRSAKGLIAASEDSDGNLTTWKIGNLNQLSDGASAMWSRFPDGVLSNASSFNRVKDIRDRVREAS